MSATRIAITDSIDNDFVLVKRYLESLFAPGRNTDSVGFYGNVVIPHLFFRDRTVIRHWMMRHRLNAVVMDKVDFQTDVNRVSEQIAIAGPGASVTYNGRNVPLDLKHQCNDYGEGSAYSFVKEDYLPEDEEPEIEYKGEGVSFCEVAFDVHEPIKTIVERLQEYKGNKLLGVSGEDLGIRQRGVVALTFEKRSPSPHGTNREEAINTADGRIEKVLIDYGNPTVLRRIIREKVSDLELLQSECVRLGYGDYVDGVFVLQEKK